MEESVEKNEKKESKEKTHCVLVLGCHRSGTSMVAGMLRKLGVFFGNDDELLGKNEFNPKGHHEHFEVMGINDAFLLSFGSAWGNPDHLPQDWYARSISNSEPKRIAALERMKKFIEMMNTRSDLWGFKDPRTCRLIPLWIEMLKRANVNPVIVTVTRNKKDVAKSLADRGNYEYEKGLVLYDTYNNDLEAYTRDFKCHEMMFEEIIKDPKQEAAELAAFIEEETNCQINDPDEAAAFVDPSISNI